MLAGMGNHRCVHLAVLSSLLLVACGTAYEGEPPEEPGSSAPRTGADEEPSGDLDGHGTESAPPNAGDGSPAQGTPTCGSWGQAAPPAAEGFTLGELEIVQRSETKDAEYVLELQSEKASVGPPRKRLFLERLCKSADCVCPGIMHVSTLGSKPTVKMAIAGDKAALDVDDPLLNGGKQTYTLCVDLTGWAEAKKLPYGSSPADCP